MPRLMSVSLTEQAVIERRKTMTRRLGWRFLKPGDRLTLCRKVMGRKPDEPLVRLVDVEVTAVRREALCKITVDDIAREGVSLVDEHGRNRFSEWYPDTGQPTTYAWVEWFCEEMGTDPYDEVTVIEWRYLDEVHDG